MFLLSEDGPSHEGLPYPTPTPKSTARAEEGLHVAQLQPPTHQQGSAAGGGSDLILSALDTSKPLILHGTYEGCPARFLLDSGATGNLVSRQFLLRNGLKISSTAIPGRRLYLPDRRALPTFSTPRCRLRIGGYNDKRVDFLAADLQGSFDVVLGMPWLHARNPDISFQTGRVALRQCGTSVILLAQRWDSPGHLFISAAQLRRKVSPGLSPAPTVPFG